MLFEVSFRHWQSITDQADPWRKSSILGKDFRFSYLAVTLSVFSRAVNSVVRQSIHFNASNRVPSREEVGRYIIAQYIFGVD